ncbi:hypothetical protein SRB5_22130 [Streptomyces sp. RB5]|uniref:EfeO-type cupredoxin-like domain-containing protein n=1 Tax=Streptomyces smaragdinus TaxID=2585196 RepID=A0A7K0CH57_9ACTN|nr:hypothetical protein [Streptomyces smaragdinus]MQY12084.1 hypothetical protein [Streptomyces smaragdinus]
MTHRTPTHLTPTHRASTHHASARDASTPRTHGRRATARRTRTLVLALVLAAALTAAGCSRPTTHHKPGTSHDTATGPVDPATQPPDESGSDLHDDDHGDGSNGSGAQDTPDDGLPDKTVRITVAGGKVTPPPGRIELDRGDRVALVVTTDRADELHVHGVDASTALAAGRATTLSFTVDRTGLFEVETHESELILTQLLVR